MRVTVIGTGYVGTVTGACLAYFGHRVTCADTDAHKIEKLRRGEMPIYEPYLDQLLQLAAARGGIDFTTELAAPAAESDVIFIAVGTPPLETGEANLCYLEAAARGIGAAMDDSKFRVVVNKSTVRVGSGNLVEVLVQRGHRGRAPGQSEGHPLRRASNPEFLREGSAIADSLYPDRIVGGEPVFPDSITARQSIVVRPSREITQRRSPAVRQRCSTKIGRFMRPLRAEHTRLPQRIVSAGFCGNH